MRMNELRTKQLGQIREPTRAVRCRRRGRDTAQACERGETTSDDPQGIMKSPPSDALYGTERVRARIRKKTDLVTMAQGVISSVPISLFIQRISWRCYRVSLFLIIHPPRRCIVALIICSLFLSSLGYKLRTGRFSMNHLQFLQPRKVISIYFIKHSNGKSLDPGFVSG